MERNPSFLPPERSSRRGRPWKGHRQVINGILWVLAVGCSWRDLPSEFGKWQTVYNRFRLWRKDNLWERMWRTLLRRADQRGQVDRSLWCVDGSVIRAHRAAAGASAASRENTGGTALGRSQGGYSTKIHLVTDGSGIPLSVAATAGQVHESKAFETVMTCGPLRLHRTDKRPRSLAGDKAYSSTKIRAWLTRRRIRAVIPTRKNERHNRSFARKTYRRRNIVERVIGWLKENRRIATRYEKLVDNYLAMIHIAFIRMLLKRQLRDSA